MSFMHQQHALRLVQKAVLEWIVPDGISAEEAMSKILAATDNSILVHEQKAFEPQYEDWLKHRSERDGN